jgi:hypothetical protein
MKLVMVLIAGSVFCGCTLTPNVNTRKPGLKWHYYGDLLSLYRDETKGSPVALVWLEEVQFRRVNPGEFQKTVGTLLTQGYRKIGFISVRSQYFVDPYDAKKLAADKGARMVVGCWFSVGNTRAKPNTVEYWYQLLDKAAPPAPGIVPNTLPLAPPRSGLY